MIQHQLWIHQLWQSWPEARIHLGDNVRWRISGLLVAAREIRNHCGWDVRNKNHPVFSFAPFRRRSSKRDRAYPGCFFTGFCMILVFFSFGGFWRHFKKPFSKHDSTWIPEYKHLEDFGSIQHKPQAFGRLRSINDALASKFHLGRGEWTYWMDMISYFIKGTITYHTKHLQLHCTVSCNIHNNCSIQYTLLYSTYQILLYHYTTSSYHIESRQVISNHITLHQCTLHYITV